MSLAAEPPNSDSSSTETAFETASELRDDLKDSQNLKHQGGWFIKLKHRFIKENFQPTLLGQIQLSTSLILLIVLAHFGLTLYARNKQHEWLTNEQKLTGAQIREEISSLTATNRQKNRLIDQFGQIQIRIEKHAEIMSYFYGQYFISISMICMASLVASVCLFFISKIGWDRANNAVINIFVVASGVVIFYGNVALAFKYEDNLKDNQIMYISYFNLRNEMLSYWATQEVLNGNEMPVNQFIHYMDLKLQEAMQIRLGFDVKQVSSVQSQLEQLNQNDRNGNAKTQGEK